MKQGKKAGPPPFMKAKGPGATPTKQVGHEMLPSRFSKSTITKGDPGQRNINQYAKDTPMDANGVGSMGQLGILMKG